MRIFLSYGHDEYQDFAMRLAESFDKRSYKVWLKEGTEVLEEASQKGSFGEFEKLPRKWQKYKVKN